MMQTSSQFAKCTKAVLKSIEVSINEIQYSIVKIVNGAIK